MSERQKKTRRNGSEAQATPHRPLPEWLAVKLDIPPDILEGGMRVELRGRQSLLVHGCRRIIEYSPTGLRLQMKGCILCVTGERLVCHSYLAGAVGVEGRIDGVCFENEV